MKGGAQSASEQQQEPQKQEQKQEGSQQPERRRYRGNCHCGAFVYEVDLPEIKTAMECNCSICHKKGYLWVFPDDQATLDIVKGTDDTLARYTFGPKKLTHRIRALQGINTWQLEKQPYDGAALGQKYVPPTHNGPLPAAIDDCKLYTGSCHCGAVTLALMSKPLDETFGGTTAECNCSVCVRNGYRWAYPDTKCVVLFASDPTHIGRYSFARHVLNKTFCTVCGVCLTNEYNHITEDERKALGALPARGFADKMKTQHPVNLRVFPAVDLTKLKAPKLNNGAKIISPQYKSP
ncbi:Centromere protein V 2 [Colletotrichum chlorophyti]|uniref:Centromere protein V 2 n=1 Tax=Colletotrichum chlorophyti TaxID=708187 RepID=A0A1Q8RAR4_9PEZI|nr:Centromere protein V 2 [Colletotrichum chlorophyti]